MQKFYSFLKAFDYGKMIAVGGSNTVDNKTMTSVEVYTPSGWKTSPTLLPRPSSWGCAVAVNATTYFIIAGFDEIASSYQNNTYFFDLTKNGFRPGPPLPVQKKMMACSRMMFQGSFNKAFLL